MAFRKRVILSFTRADLKKKKSEATPSLHPQNQIHSSRCYYEIRLTDLQTDRQIDKGWLSQI